MTTETLVFSPVEPQRHDLPAEVSSSSTGLFTSSYFSSHYFFLGRVEMTHWRHVCRKDHDRHEGSTTSVVLVTTGVSDLCTSPNGFQCGVTPYRDPLTRPPHGTTLLEVNGPVGSGRVLSEDGPQNWTTNQLFRPSQSRVGQDRGRSS